MLGLVEGGASGEKLLHEAVAVLETSQARLEYARALVELGAALRRGNKRSDSREYLRQGLELAHKLGATRARGAGADRARGDRRASARG